MRGSGIRESSKPDSVLGISFDGLAISGIISELLNAAAVHHARGRRVLFDLGFDITLHTPSGSESAFLPPWLHLIRAIGDPLPAGYSAELINDSYERVLTGLTVADAGIYDGVRNEITSRLISAFEDLQVRFLHVENGTLPDNPVFTDALYAAIAEYGSRQKLGKYVLWRDFDLMWSAEPHLYGPYPYPGVHKPEVNSHIHYAVVTDWMRKRMEAWAPGPVYHVIPDRFSVLENPHPGRRSLRAAYGVPEDAYLIARCTRIIPQKSIERDLRVLDAIQRRLIRMGDPRPVFLFVGGHIDEDPAEYQHLRTLEQNLTIAGRIIWADGLLPFNADPALQGDRFSIRDLLSESDLSSFLTTYDYEGFGNPPGEAMAMGVPYMATTYELYQEVYGNKGAVGPLLPIDRDSSPADAVPEYFIDWVLRILLNREYRRELAARNLEVCRRYFSIDALARQLGEIFGESF